MAAPFYPPDRDRLDRPTVLALRLLRLLGRTSERLWSWLAGDGATARCDAARGANRAARARKVLWLARRRAKGAFQPARPRSGRRPIGLQNGRRTTRLRLAPAPVQNPFGIAVRLRPSLEDQVAGGIEGRAAKPGRHRSIGGIARILPVDNLGHPPQRPQHLLLVDYAVMQPIGDVLA